MNSSAVTGGITFSISSIEPVISWGLNGFHTPIPETVPMLTAAALITAGHAIYNGAVYIAKKKGWLPPDTPAA